MKQPIPDIELIERYFDQDLTDTERSGFQERLQRDAGFLQLFNQEKILIEAVRYHGAKEDLRFLREIDRSMDHPKRSFFNVYAFPLAAAASLALIALMVLWPLRRPAGTDLFEAHYSPYPNVFEPTLRGEIEQTARARAFQAYENGDYAAAASLFVPVLEKKREPGVVMLQAHALLMSSHTPEAMQLFSELAAGGTPLAPDANWYLALCHLKREEHQLALPLLKSVAATHGPVARKAQSLLKELD